MATAETFSVYRDDPEWQDFSFQEKNQLRQEWVRRRAISAGKMRDQAYIGELMKDAYADIPELLPREPTFTERHPNIAAAGETAFILARTPQQYVANYLAQIGQPIKGPLEALVQPIKKTGEWMRGEREATELPGGMTTEILTDPLSYLGYGLGAKFFPALRKAKAGAEMLRAVKAPGVVGEMREVIPKTFAEFSPFQTEVYRKTLQAGRRFFSPDELKQVGATLANLPEKEAAVTLNKLGKMKNANEARSLLAWAQSPQWKRQPRWWKSKVTAGAEAAIPGKTKITPSAEEVADAAARNVTLKGEYTLPPLQRGGSVSEEMTQMQPRDWLKRLMEEPGLE